jgi:hypothetical protein
VKYTTFIKIPDEFGHIIIQICGKLGGSISSIIFFSEVYDRALRKPEFASLFFRNGLCLVELFASEADELVQFDSLEIDCSNTLMAEFVECCAMNLHTFVNSEMAAYNAITGSFDELFGDDD